MNQHVSFRKVFQKDMPTLVNIEYRSHFGYDPDFEVQCFGRHGWTAGDIESCLSEENTRGWVMEEGDGNVVAYFIYELMDDHYLIRRLIVHPDYRKADFGRSILHRIYQRLVRSATRKKLKAVVREDDLDTCGWMAHIGFKSRLIRGGWDKELDGIEFFFETTEQAGEIEKSAKDEESKK